MHQGTRHQFLRKEFISSRKYVENIDLCEFTRYIAEFDFFLRNIYLTHCQNISLPSM